jgi:hypothetical protein
VCKGGDVEEEGCVGGGGVGFVPRENMGWVCVGWMWICACGKVLGEHSLL